MPITLIFAIIFGFIALILLPFLPKASDEARVGMTFVSAILGGIALLLMLVDSATIVPTKTVGVVTSFGRPVGTLSNGLHFIPLWEKVTRFDASIQTDSHTGTKECTTVRLSNQSSACVDNSIRWRIKESAADDLYRDYKDFDAVKDSLVTRELTAALNDAFSSYDPLQSINPSAGSPSSLDTVAATVTKRMQDTIGSQVEVLNVVIPLVRYDESTQDKINQFQAELANTRIAQQKEKTAAAEARANRLLASSVSKDPNVLVSKCLDLVAQAIKSGHQLPAGFSCWPGDGKSVVIPGK